MSDTEKRWRVWFEYYSHQQKTVVRRYAAATYTEAQADAIITSNAVTACRLFTYGKEQITTEP